MNVNNVYKHVYYTDSKLAKLPLYRRIMHLPFFCTTTYKWQPHPSSAGGQSMLSNKRIPRQLSVSGFLYLNPQAPGNWACNVESKIAPSDSVGSSMAGSDSSSVTRTYWAILGSSESSLSMLKISCESILLPVYPQSQRKNYIYGQAPLDHQLYKNGDLTAFPRMHRF